MNILLTGHAGFIGYHTARALLARGDSVVGVDIVNDYYDPALKRARLERLAQMPLAEGQHYASHEIDIADAPALRELFAAPTVAAELISGGMGMSMAVSSDAMGGGTTTSFGQYFVIVLTLIFLATGAHLHWIALLAESYNAFPPGQTWLGADRFAAIAGFASFMFETALRIHHDHHDVG